MPIEVTGPDGKMHSFLDGTPMTQIQANMAAVYGGPPATPGADRPVTPTGQPLSGTPGYMPPGTTPARMQPQENAPDPNMPPLSEEAQQLQRRMGYYAYKGNRAGVMGAENALKLDPTVQARGKFSTAMGEQAATLAGKQAAGTRVYSAVNELEQKARAWYEHAPLAFSGATGPWNSSSTIQGWTGTLPLVGNKAAYDFHTLMDHDIHKLTALYREMPSSGRSAGSDAQDATFQEAMGEARKATSPEAFFAIMQSAKQLIRDKAGLSHDFDVPYRAMNPKDVEAVNKYATSQPIRPGSKFIPFKAATPQDAEKLPAGSHYVTPDGRLMQR